MKELLNIMLGQMNGPAFLAAMLFAILGWVLYKYFTAKKRDPESPRTPGKWDWRFWINDNWLELVLSIMQLYILVRFAPSFLSQFFPDIWVWAQDSDVMFVYFLIGYGMSYLMKKLKRLYLEKSNE